MKKWQYVVSICIDVISPKDGETIDNQLEYEYYDTREEAEKAAEKYQIGDIIGGYGDGAECKVAMVEVLEEPEEIDYFD